LEKGNSIVLRNSSTNDSTAKSVETIISSSDFAELHSGIVQTLIKLGHYSILYEQLEYAVCEIAESKTGSIHSSLSAFLKYILVALNTYHDI
jgi:hypothetical protein